MILGELLGLTLLLSGLLPSDAERVGRLDHPAIREASGIVASRRYLGVYWVHNDSGNSPVLFAVRRDGTLIGEFPVGAPNIDWEDIAADDDGHLYIGDIGNNGGLLPLRTIYRVAEPNPAQPSGEPLAATPVVVYRFPPDGRFDAEGLVVEGARALVFSKRLDGRPAAIHALPLDGSGTLLKPATPVQVAVLKEFTEPATGADLTADGRHLAVVSNRLARVYRRVGDVDWRLVAVLGHQGQGVEAIAWDGDDLILADEGRSLERISARVWKAQASRGRPAALPRRN